MKEKRWVPCSEVSNRRTICMVLIPLALLFLSATMSVSAQPTQPSGTSVSTTESKGVVTGKVVDVEGNALAQVEVTALDSNSFEAAQVYTAGGDITVGQFSIGLEPGNYRLEFKKRGYEFRTLSVNVVSDKVGYLPDVVLDYSLRVSLSATSIQVDAGDLVEVSVTISNRGFEAETCSVSISAPDGWTARLQSGDVSVLGFTLDPSESRTYALKVEPSYVAVSGEVALTVFGWTTYQETLTVDVSEEEPPLLSATHTALKGSPGETVQFGVKIANPFSEELAIGLAVEVPQGWQGSLDASSGVRISGLTLSPFEVYSADLVVKIPSYAEPAAYEIVLTATSDSIDDRLVLLLEVEGMKQRMLTAKYPMVEGAPGGRVEFDVEVVNLLEEEGVFEFELTAPAGWEGEVTGPEGGALLAATLDAGEVLHAAVVLEVPDDASPGKYESSLVASSGSLREELTLKAQIARGEAHVELSTGTPFLDAYSGSDAI
ncbi:MAG: NEW3 domain-containing protein, partial [Aigarchaeota archaeon]|nr:NEW3 domain-containing protein [Aigarchaeota archaeon]